MQVANIKLVIYKSTKRIVDIGFTIADRFNFSTQQFYACNIFVKYVVLKISFLVLYINILVHHGLFCCKYANYFCGLTTSTGTFTLWRTELTVVPKIRSFNALCPCDPITIKSISWLFTILAIELAALP